MLDPIELLACHGAVVNSESWHKIARALRGRRLIYGLVDPVTWLLRYVGKSDKGFKRTRDHRQPANLKSDTHCARWIQRLHRTGYDIGAASRGRKHSDESRALRSERQRGRKQSPEAIEKTRVANIGRPVSIETRAKHRANALAQWAARRAA